MRKNLLLIFCMAISFLGKAQAYFEFERAWGTYLGPIGGRSYASTFNGQAIFFDSQNNIYTKGYVAPISGYPESYYQQFSLGGGQTFQFGPSTYSTLNFYTKFSTTGVLSSYQFSEYQTNNPGTYTKELMFIDHLDNKYFQYEIDTSNSPITITPGTWLTTSGAYALAKYDAADNFVWATYLPSASRITTDGNQNVYVSGYSNNGLNIGTPGAFQDNFQYMVSNGNLGSGFLVKLNPNGQKLWGTFYPGFSSVIQHFGDSVYLGVTAIPQTNQVVIPTSNAFQSVKASFALLKINADNGSRIWGTYYANPTGSNSVRKIEVNESGLYVLGDETYQSNNATPNFYGTTGSHKPQNTSPMDVFLTKFSHDGARIWSTYIGGTAWDLAQGSHQPMALSGNDIFICRQVWGFSNNVSTPNVHQQLPQQNINTSTNLVFSKFNSDGVLQWTSYYGGTGQSSDQGFNIAVKDTSLYLYGDTVSPTGFATAGSMQPNYTDPYPAISPATKKYMNYLVKFNLKPLSTSETAKNSTIQIFNNPNNGNFSLRGDLFSKENFSLSIFDLSGKMIFKTELLKSQTKEHILNLDNLLQNGNYMLNLTDKSGVLIQNFKIVVKK